MKIFSTLLLLLLTKNIFSQDSCFHKSNYEPHLIEEANGERHFSPDYDVYMDDHMGCNAPSFKATTITGKQISLDELKDKVVILNFWYIHCSACVREFQALNRLVDEYADKGVVFLAFALDKKGDIDTFLLKHPLKYDIIAEAKSIQDLYNVIVCPTNMVLGKNHKVVKMLHGSMLKRSDIYENYEQIKPFIEQALKDK